MKHLIFITIFTSVSSMGFAFEQEVKGGKIKTTHKGVAVSKDMGGDIENTQNAACVRAKVAGNKFECFNGEKTHVKIGEDCKCDKEHGFWRCRVKYSYTCTAKKNKKK